MDADVNAALSPVEANSLESAMPYTEEPLMFGEAIEAKIMPTSPVEYGQKITLERRGSFEGLIPRSTPKGRKPAWKSKTYGGVALPAFAEAMKAGSKSLKKTDTAEKLVGTPLLFLHYTADVWGFGTLCGRTVTVLGPVVCWMNPDMPMMGKHR